MREPFLAVCVLGMVVSLISAAFAALWWIAKIVIKTHPDYIHVDDPEETDAFRSQTGGTSKDRRLARRAQRRASGLASD